MFLNSANSFVTWLNQRVDNSPLILFRIFFGLLLFAETAGAIATGWVKANFITPKLVFTFIGFEWLQPLPGNGMYFYYGVMALLGLLVMAGAWYRVSLGLFTLLWWGSYLMQKTSYNNHYYLLILLCFLMLLVPANAYLSIDARRKPEIKNLHCPRWCTGIFVLQIGLVYTYAALAKIYPDWLQAIPISIWFKQKATYPVIGAWLQLSVVQLVIAYGGIVFDLLITPLLLWKRTRRPAFILSLFFHLFNSIVFGVGVFPYLAIALSVFFFPPETIRRIFLRKKPLVMPGTNSYGSEPMNPVLFYGLAVYFLVQIALPLRHWFIPGDVHWTEEGHRMAWQMMLRSKTGTIHYKVQEAGGRNQQFVWPEHFLTTKQSRILATRPDMIWQFAQFLKKHYRQTGYRQPEVYAITAVSLNGRPAQPLVNPAVNLAAVPWTPFKHATWIMPLK